MTRWEGKRKDGKEGKGLGTYVANRAMPHSAAGRLHRGCKRRRTKTKSCIYMRVRGRSIATDGPDKVPGK